MDVIKKPTVGVLGATSPVGQQVLRLLSEQGFNIIAFSRKRENLISHNIQWVNLTTANLEKLKKEVGVVTHWVTLCSIWIVPELFSLIQSLGAKRLVCISSTSKFTKISSSSVYEEKLVARLNEGESTVSQWAENNNIAWSILRPTLIYGRSTDRNLSEIVKIINKFGFFPLFGQSKGLRQPIYVDDVAKATIQALMSDSSHNKSYNISGSNQITYREMVSRIFTALNRKPIFITIPLWLFNFTLLFIKLIPKYKNWNADMVLRMNKDMIFEHTEAALDFNFSPQEFKLEEKDVQIL